MGRSPCHNVDLSIANHVVHHELTAVVARDQALDVGEVAPSVFVTGPLPQWREQSLDFVAAHRLAPASVPEQEGDVERRERQDHDQR
jgi:hypothetical protein